MAYLYCHNALSTIRTTDAQTALSEVNSGVSEQLRADITAYNTFYSVNRKAAATKIADTANDTYLKASGEERGISSYGDVCNLLVNWHIQEVVLPSLAEKESAFDPYDEGLLAME